MKNIVVVASIIIHKNKILCVQRGVNKLPYISKKYEFPGGKMEFGEKKEDTIKREILEELNMHIEVKEVFLTVNHQYPDFMLEMHSFICHCKDTTVTLTEHLCFKWLDKKELMSLDWAAADLPIVEKLMRS